MRTILLGLALVFSCVSSMAALLPPSVKSTVFTTQSQAQVMSTPLTWTAMQQFDAGIDIPAGQSIQFATSVRVYFDNLNGDILVFTNENFGGGFYLSDRLYDKNGNAYSTTEPFPLAGDSIKNLLTTPTRLVFDGDSLTASNDSYRFYLSNTLSQAGASIIVSNTAVSGQAIPQMLNRYTNFVQPCKPAGGTNAILFAWGGINDIFFATNGYATIIANLSNYWALAKADGFTLGAFTISSRSDFPGVTNENTRAIINSWIRSQPTWDFLVDVDAVFPYWSTDFYQLEGAVYIHFNTNANRVIADAALGSLFAPKQIQNPPDDLIARHVGIRYFPQGSTALPSITFSDERNTGFSRASSGILGLSIAGAGEFVWAGTLYRMSSDIKLQWASGSGFSTGGDTENGRFGVNSNYFGTTTTPTNANGTTISSNTVTRVAVLQNTTNIVGTLTAAQLGNGNMQLINSNGSLWKVTSDGANLTWSIIP